MNYCLAIVHPYSGGYSAVVYGVAKAIFVNVCKEFCIRYANDVPQHVGLVEGVMRTAGQEQSDKRFLCSEVGSAALFLQGSRPGPVCPERVYAQIGLAALKIRILSNFEFVVSGYSLVTFLGKVMAGTNIRISAKDRSLSISIDEGLQWNFKYGRIGNSTALVWHSLGKVEDALVVKLDTSILIGSQEWEGLFGDHTHKKAELLPSMYQDMQNAFEILKRYSPAYFDWVTQGINQIAPVEKKGERVIGGASQFHSPGNIQLVLPSSPLEIAEVLVHEASHQMLHPVLRLCKMVKEGAPEAYSEIKKTSRPLDRILLSYHAFGNILLMMEDVVTNSAGKIYFPRHEYIKELTRSFFEPLLEHYKYLTDQGILILSTLANELESRNILKVC